ncbi:hypothetical protein JHK86_006153 [Glycine max]|nr:hypothetical protein JHK86_006153 [Glycine max]
MMAEDLGVEAKEAAVREVAKLLPLPELLQSISSIKADYISRQQANDAQLSTMVAEQVEQSQAGLKSLSFSERTINQLRENFVSIENLCQECQTLIDNHDQIKILSNARNNLNTTLKDVEGMMSISDEAAEARDSLSDDKEIVNTYERLTALDGKRRFALAAAGSHKEEVGRLREYFEDVDRTWETFEKTLWGHISNFYKLSKESPQTLVRAVRVVEMQEILDQQIAEEAAEAEGDGAMASVANPRNTGILLRKTKFRPSIYSRYIEERSFRRFVEACLEETVVVYVDHLLTQKNYIKEETIERMRLDEEVIMDFFREHISVSVSYLLDILLLLLSNIDIVPVPNLLMLAHSAQKVENRVSVLSDLRELASAESLDTFTLIYTNILEHQPDCPPEVVEKLVGLREGIPRKDAKEVIQECKEIYENSLVDGRPPKAGFVFRRVKCLTATKGGLWRKLT